MDEIFADKKRIRLQIKELKKQITETEKQQETERVFGEIELLPEFQAANVVLMYWSLPDELPTHQAIAKWSGEKTILLPVVISDEVMEVKQYSDANSMTKSTLGIEEPNAEEPFVGKIDLVIVPGIAFDRERNRLGRGKAYYDRFLTQHAEAYKIGVGFNFQLIEKVPTTEMDVKMDKVVVS